MKKRLQREVGLCHCPVAHCVTHLNSLSHTRSRG